MSTGFWLNYALALVVVALMLGGLYIIVRGLARGRLLVSADRRLVTVLESTMLAQHVSVHVVKAGSQYLLIGGGQGHVNTLAQLPADEVEAWLEQQRLTAGLNRSLFDALRLRKQ
jgi:flagellar biogenesis protein FliO